MSKRKTGKEIAQRVYRDLEKLYGVKIDKYGEFVPLTDAHLSIPLWSKVHAALDAVRDKVGNLPEPVRPTGRNARDKRWHAKPRPGDKPPF
jgi:hypothetical protein